MGADSLESNAGREVFGGNVEPGPGEVPALDAIDDLTANLGGNDADLQRDRRLRAGGVR